VSASNCGKWGAQSDKIFGSTNILVVSCFPFLTHYIYSTVILIFLKVDLEKGVFLFFLAKVFLILVYLFLDLIVYFAHKYCL